MYAQFQMLHIRTLLSLHLIPLLSFGSDFKCHDLLQKLHLETRVTVIEPSRIVDSQSSSLLLPVLVPVQTSSAPQKNTQYLRSIQTVAERLHRHFPRAKAAKTVVYPMVGADFSLLEILFPQAEYFILIDETPFFLEKDILA